MRRVEFELRLIHKRIHLKAYELNSHSLLRFPQKPDKKRVCLKLLVKRSLIRTKDSAIPGRSYNLLPTCRGTSELADFAALDRGVVLRQLFLVLALVVKGALVVFSVPVL